MSDAISAWWNAFESQAPRIDALFRQRDDWDLASWMETHLGAVHPELMWEYGPAVRGSGHRLVITPEGRHDLRPLVRELLQRAPELPDWEFYEYRLPEDFEQTLMAVEGRARRDVSDMRFQAQRGDFNRIDLLFISPECDNDEGMQAAFIATECLLGEKMLDQWVGVVDVASEPDDEGPRESGLPELRTVVEGLIGEIQSELPSDPWYTRDIESGNWAMFELEPEKADDYAGQSDLFVCTTILPEMWENALVGAPFDSSRFSRCGELFCYLKIEGTQGLAESFQDRSDLEEALNDVLRPAGAGCVIGGGTGIRYSYIELALADVDHGWQAMRAVLRQGGVPERTWLLFHDDERAADWRGAYESTPPPPSADGED